VTSETDPMGTSLQRFRFSRSPCQTRRPR